MDLDRLSHIWIEIANGRGRHGGFLQKFAECYAQADPANVALIRDTAEKLVTKYGLNKYLDNFPSTDGFPPDPEPDPNLRRRA